MCVQAVREWAVYVAHKLLVNVLVYVGRGGGGHKTNCWIIVLFLLLYSDIWRSRDYVGRFITFLI